MKTFYILLFKSKFPESLMLACLLLACLPQLANAQEEPASRNKGFKWQEQSPRRKTIMQAEEANLTGHRTSAATITRPGTEKTYHADTSGWALSETITYTYDAMGRVTDRLTKGSDGINTSRSLITYDIHGNETQELYYYWSGSRWDLNHGYQYAYTYNTNGRITEIIEKALENGSWVTDRRRTYTYNASGAILTEESHRWDGISWSVRWKDIYTYASSGSALTGIMYLYANDTTGVLENDERVIDIVWRTSTINNSNGYPEGEPLSYTYQGWEKGNWVNDEKTTITYGQNSSNVALRQEWKNNSWVNYRRSTANFDAQGNETLWQYEGWENGAWAMKDGSKNFYTYNTSGQITENIYQSWNEDYRMYENRYRSVYSNFQTITATPVEAPALLTEVYPNPTSDKISIRIAPSASTVFITLTNITGKTVFTKLLPATALHHELNLSAFPAGLYMLQLTSGNALSTRKVIKQ